MGPEEAHGMEVRREGASWTPARSAAGAEAELLPATTLEPAAVDGKPGALAELEALRREIERWHALAGKDRGLLEALLHHSPHGIIVSDAAGRLVLQNRAAERIWAGSASAQNVEAWGRYRAFHRDGRPFAAGDWSMARCLDTRAIVGAEEVHYQRFDGTYGTMLGSCAPIFGDHGELEGALSVFADITELKHAEEQLRLITDTLPALIAYVDAGLRYQFTSLGYERWFGVAQGEILGRGVADVLGEPAFEIVGPRLRRALAGEAVTYQARVPYRLGGAREVEATYVPHLGPDRSVLGVVTLVTDISERKRMQEERARWTERTERLLEITAALADAVTPSQVLEAVVDRVATALHAKTLGLWLVDEGGAHATLARHVGYANPGRAAFVRLGLDSSGEAPAGDAMRDGAALWFDSRDALAARYPRLAALLDPQVGHVLAALPLIVEGRTIGALAVTFDPAKAPSGDERSLLVVVARHSALAIERMRLLRGAEQAYAETQLLYRLTNAVNRAGSMEEVYEASLDTIRSALGVERAAILFFDAEGTMRFTAWRGLSDRYRASVEGHSPWGAGEVDPAALWIEDVRRSQEMAPFADVLDAEGIAAIGFVPLVYEARVLGKFMLYWPTASRCLRGRRASRAASRIRSRRRWGASARNRNAKRSSSGSARPCA
ncbi:MAG: PAS domain-containing protein [Polyangiaceae bacterium]